MLSFCSKVLRARCLHTTPVQEADKAYKFVVVGAGTGGLAVSSALGRKFGAGNVAVVEPSEVHYYQPMWTLVGAGVKTLQQSSKSMAEVMPPQVDWIKQRVAGFVPDKNAVTLADDTKLRYDYLIVALGLQVNFNQVKGLLQALEDPDSGVSSNYSSKYVEKTYKNLQRFQGGNALFNIPPMPIKCPGAPQKIMYLADDYWRQNGVRDKTTITYNTPLGVIFGVKKYADSLMKVVERKNIKLNFKRKILEVRGDKKEAVFEFLDNGTHEVYKYDMMHAVPPMGPLDIMKGSPICDQLGWVDVNRETLQHIKYPNIFAIGDCTNVPASRTAAACAAQAAVLRRNLLSLIKGAELTAKYDGYASCPLITGYGKTILAEFDFDGKPLETFPFDQGKERWSMYHLKKDAMPQLYWYGLIRGIWDGPKLVRDMMHFWKK